MFIEDGKVSHPLIQYGYAETPCRFAQASIRPIPIQVQGAHFHIPWRISKPGSRQKLFLSSVDLSDRNVALPGCRFCRDQFLHGQTETREKVGSRPIQGLTNDVEDFLPLFHAKDTKTAPGKVNGCSDSGKASPDDDGIGFDHQRFRVQRFSHVDPSEWNELQMEERFAPSHRVGTKRTGNCNECQRKEASIKRWRNSPVTERFPLLGSLFQLPEVAAVGFVPECGQKHNRKQTRNRDGAGGYPKSRDKSQSAESLREQTATFAEACNPSGSATSHLKGIAFCGVGQNHGDDPAGTDDQQRGGNNRAGKDGQVSQTAQQDCDQSQRGNPNREHEGPLRAPDAVQPRNQNDGGSCNERRLRDKLACGPHATSFAHQAAG